MNKGVRKDNNNNRVQDAYSLRCVPQVHGITRETFFYVKEIIEKEINAPNDNPLIIEKDGKLESISVGNFHGYLYFLI
jgi:histidine ammonia-lyase